MFSGILPTDPRVTSLFRFAREGVYTLLLCDFIFSASIAYRQPIITRASLLIVGGCLLLIAISTFYSVQLNLPVPVILSGLRFLEYIPLALISAFVFQRCGNRPFQRIAKSVLFFLVVESVIGFVETRLHLNYFGTTFLGARAFGTFTSPNIFGGAMVFCFLLVYISYKGSTRVPLISATLFDVFASGSRAAILSFIFIIGVFVYQRVRNRWARAMMILTATLSFPLLMILVNNSAITGRGTGIGAGGYERLSVWSRLLDKLDSTVNFLFGWGMGLGSNTVFSLYGSTLKDAYISDNTLFFLIGSYGIFGVLFFVSVLILVTWRLRHDPPGLALMAAFILQLLIGQALETYPMNVVAMLMVGWRLAATKTRINGIGKPETIPLGASAVG